TLLACGDKFLVSSRGTRYQLGPPLYKPAAILIYTNPASDFAKALVGVPVEATLRGVGYRPTTVATSAELDKALSRDWDLILVGLSDAETVSKRVKRNTSILPVVVNAAVAEMKQTKKQYSVVLKAPIKSHTLLAAVDQALASRSKQIKAKMSAM